MRMTRVQYLFLVGRLLIARYIPVELMDKIITVLQINIWVSNNLCGKIFFGPGKQNPV